MTLTTTAVVFPFGEVEEFQAEADLFEATTGFGFLDLVWGGTEAEARQAHPAWVVDWAAYLDQWDCWLFQPVPTQEYLALEALEEEADHPAPRRTRGHRRPQAVRAARTRRSTYLGRLAYR